jgi:hypothetical protein
MAHDVVPVRWDITRRPQLGQLLDGVPTESYGGFRDDLLTCMVGVLAASHDGDLFFVGRSPASLFDALSGLLRATSWRDRVWMLHFSMYDLNASDVGRRYPRALEGIHAYFARHDLVPGSRGRRDRPAVFVDLVSSGGTFEHLLDLLQGWCIDEHRDWRAVRRRLRLVAIVGARGGLPRRYGARRRARATKPLTWSPVLPRALSTRVSVPERLRDYLGNRQPKACLSYAPESWGVPRGAAPLRDERALGALREARALFEWGASPSTRAAVARLMAEQSAMRRRRFRSLGLELTRPRPSSPGVVPVAGCPPIATAGAPGCPEPGTRPARTATSTSSTTDKEAHPS